MYAYQSAWVREHNKGQYEQTNIQDTSLTEVFLKYDHIYVYLTNTYAPDTVLGLDLTTLRSELMLMSETLAEYLASLGNAALPTDTPPLERKVTSVTYQDARRGGCYLQRIYQHAHPDSEYPLDDKRNLLIQSPDDDDNYVLFHQDHLVTLGGYIHRTEHTAHGVLVPHAVETLEQSGVDTVGLMSFAQQGGVQQIHLGPDDIHPDGNGNPLGKRFAIDFEEPIGHKSVGVVMLGRLILDPRILRKFNDRRILVDVERLDLETLYQHARRDIPLGDLPIEPVRGQPDVVLIAQLRSDENIRAIMALPQSMVVVFDAERLVETFLPLSNSGVSGRAYSDQLPTEPVIGAQGLYVDYWVQNDWGRYVLNFPEQWVRRYFHDTYDGQDRTVTTGHHSTVHPRYTPHFRRHRLETHTLE